MKKQPFNHIATMKMPASHHPKFATAGMALAMFVGFASISQAATTIYLDSFTRNGSVHNSDPDTTLGSYGGTAGAKWIAGANFTTNGTDALNGGHGKAFLPFSPVVGHIYTLSATMDNISPTTKWAAVGFATINFSSPPSLTSSFHLNGSNTAPWLLLGTGTTGTWFKGPGATTSTNYSGASTGYNTFTIVLDTQSDVNNWTATMFLNDVQKAQSTYSAATWTQNAIGFGAEDDGTNSSISLSSFSLTTSIPEPSAALLGSLGMLALFRRRR